MKALVKYTFELPNGNTVSTAWVKFEGDHHFPSRSSVVDAVQKDLFSSIADSNSIGASRFPVLVNEKVSKHVVISNELMRQSAVFFELDFYEDD